MQIYTWSLVQPESVNTMQKVLLILQLNLFFPYINGTDYSFPVWDSGHISLAGKRENSTVN